jgi:hypothetical protein
MTFADYPAFRVAFMQLADGDDVATASFSVATADLMIGLAESRVYRDLRASTMVSALSIVPSAGVYTLPSDLLELKEVYFSGKAPLEIIPLELMRKLVAGGTAPAGDAQYAAQDGNKLVFWPTQTTATALGSYYARPGDLKTVTWANATTFARYPECFLFAALCELSPFLGEDARLPVWEAKYRQSVQNAHADEAKRVYGGSPLRMRAR